jgi:hypothetical protein
MRRGSCQFLERQVSRRQSEPHTPICLERNSHDFSDVVAAGAGVTRRVGTIAERELVIRLASLNGSK